MKVRIRAKAGGGLTVSDENGQPIEGLVAVEIEAFPGQVPSVRLTVEGAQITVDADADLGIKATVAKSPKGSK